MPMNEVVNYIKEQSSSVSRIKLSKERREERKERKIKVVRMTKALDHKFKCIH